MNLRIPRLTGGWLLSLWLLFPAGGGAYAQSSGPATLPSEEAVRAAAARAEQVVAQIFQGQSITLGLGFAISTFSHLRDDQFPDAGDQSVSLSDSGSVTPFIAYNSPEKLFAHEVFPDGGFLGMGGIAFGINIVANVATFRANREFKSGQLIGAASDNRVQGVYALGAPLLFVRLGPLFGSTSESYLRTGVGYGVAMAQFDGKLRYRRDGFADVKEHLVHPPNALDAAVVNLLELRVGRWLVQATSLGFGGRTTTGSYHVGNLAVNGGYTFGF